MRFQVDFCVCMDALNTQEEYFESCVDEGTLPSGDRQVRVTCSDPSGIPLFSGSVVNGDEITISSESALPESLTCGIFNLAGNRLQAFEVNISGNVDLYLKDKFGSFSLVACDDQDCFTEVAYTYETGNIGNVSMSITKSSRTRGGQTINLLPESNPEVPVDQSIYSSETERIDICADGEYTTELMVLAAPVGGGLDCENDTTFSFKILDSSPVPTPSEPTLFPTNLPLPVPTLPPTPLVTSQPIPNPTTQPTSESTPKPTLFPTIPPLPDPTLPPTPLPTQLPTLVPTTQPTSELTPEPTQSPTIAPVIDSALPPFPLATSSPTANSIEPAPESIPRPTSFPTNPSVPDPTPIPTPLKSSSATPTSPFTAELTPGPSLLPTNPTVPDPALSLNPLPTPLPTLTHTTQATPEPTPGLNTVPIPGSTSSPSASSSNVAMQTPTMELPCSFELEIECVPPQGVSSCNATPPPVEQCQGQPFEMGFIYNGGDCEVSHNIQASGDSFSCEDLNGAPPTQRGETSYIVVSALTDNTIYFEGTVAVGDTFTVSDGGNNLLADHIINIYQNQDTNTTANLLQAVQYDSSCSSDLFLKDSFGAVQLLELVNEVQGKISSFANQTFDLDIAVPNDIGGNTAVMRSLTVASNIDPFFYNLTDKISGVEVQVGDILEVTIAIPIDLTQRKTYTLLITLEAVMDTGTLCRATELTSFTAGYPLPPIFPTFSPNQAPSGIVVPTVDPAATSCSIDANIECVTASGRNCRDISVPTSAVCFDENGPTVVDFLFTGIGCGTTAGCVGGAVPGSDAYIEVIDQDRTAFAGVVAKGEIFRVSGPFDQDYLEIAFSSVSEGGPGDEIFQNLDRLELGCSGEQGIDFTLLTNYGALQLVGFSSVSQGSQNIIEILTLAMSIANNGTTPVTLGTAVGSSPFEPDPINLIPNGPTELTMGESISIETGVVLSLADTLEEFVFELTATGTSLSGRACNTTSRYVIVLE